MKKSNIKNILTNNSYKAKAIALSRFFKTGKGQYGEGDKFLGVMVPQIRAVVNKYWSTTTEKEIKELITNRYHELRLAGLLILVKKYEKGTQGEQQKIYNYYLAHLKYINNWDLIDLTAPHIVGKYLLNVDRKILYDLARSTSLWERRVAILSTFAFIRNNDFKDTIAISKILLHDDHDLIHKAVGWMLREIGKKDIDLLKEFLSNYATTMPRTMLRYAIEKLDPKELAHYMQR